MRLKRFASALCLAAGLAVSLPSISAVTGINCGISAVLAVNEGWNEDETGHFYIKDGQRLTGMQKINETDTYYFDANGYRQSGAVKVGEKTYFFSYVNGKLSTGVSGMAQTDYEPDVKYYFNKAKDGSVVTDQWVKVSSKYFYADEKGQIRLGTIKVDGKLYHITNRGRMTAYGRSSYDKNYYYPNSQGVLQTKLQKIGGYKYYFNPRTGARQTGSIKIGKRTYYFNTKTGKAVTGWLKLVDGSGDSKFYYYNKKGYRLTGFRTFKGKKYYLNPKDNGARVESSWITVDKKTYYFNDDGVMQSGFIKIGSKTYYTDSNGVRKKGWVTVGGRKYYFTKKNATMKTGWFTSKGKKYYLNPSKASSVRGAAVTGFARINGKWYFFNNNGQMKTGWVTQNMKKYYFDKETGVMYTGKHTIDGKTYNFGSDGAINLEVTGSYSIKVNRRQCFVVIYKGDTPVKAFVCSTAADGVSTPAGTFTILDKLRWHELMGPSWGQYCEHITSDILFHSVTYSQLGNIHSLSASAYNKLGTPASHGCIRLTVAHAKWIYDNIPIGTKVTISDNVPRPTNIAIEQAQKIPLTQNYDPTDPAIK